MAWSYVVRRQRQPQGHERLAITFGIRKRVLTGKREPASREPGVRLVMQTRVNASPT